MTRLCGLVLALTLLPAAAYPQDAPGAAAPSPAVGDRPLRAGERAGVVEMVAHLLDTLYVVPETGSRLAAGLRASLAAGGFDTANTAGALAESLDRHLQAAQDRHLGVRFSPGEASQPVLTVEAWRSRGEPEGRATRRSDPVAARTANYGVTAAEVMAGNVGYLEVREFMAGDLARAAMAHAMGLLAHTDAMIVDVRRCPGGSGEAVSALASYFFGPEPRVLMRRHHRPTNTSRESTTVEVAGTRRPDVPLYVLIGPGSASACESFAFTLQQWGRARTVGEPTAGAGYNNTVVDLGLGLRLSISVGSAVHPKTGRSFERVGVAPDVTAPAEQARTAAHAEALRALSAAAPGDRRGVYEAALARLVEPVGPARPAPPPPAALQEYVGRYGVREVTLREGVLHYRRLGGHGGPLRPLGGDRFDLNGEVLVSFERAPDGSVRALRIQWSNGRSETAARDVAH